jgi:DNA helicase II / ATP-dependent DNA helicase PcrA
MTGRASRPDTSADLEVFRCLDGSPLQSFVMVAGAGSGKTTSLIKALDHVRRTRGDRLRRCGQSVACITYTEVAVREIREEVRDQTLFQVSTIHSFLWTIIKPFQQDIRLWVGRRLCEKIADREEKLSSPRIRGTTRDRAARDIARYRKQMAALPMVSGFRYEIGSDYGNGILGHSDVLRMVPELLNEKALLRKVVARRFPFVFVDESQDTEPRFVEALKSIDQQMSGVFCVGFFGDPMQQIYSMGVGAVVGNASWRTITKHENFRCSEAVLSVINRIRADGDGIQQVGGRMVSREGTAVPVPGSACFYVVPADNDRARRLEALQEKLTTDDETAGRRAQGAGARVLVLVHRMAARRLGFGELFAAMFDNSPDSVKTGFVEGTAWPLRPFLSCILPIAEAFESGDEFEVMSLLRRYSPMLQRDPSQEGSLAQRLVLLRAAVTKLHQLLRSDEASVAHVLRHVWKSRLALLDERLARYLEVDNSMDEDDGSDDAEEEAGVMRRYLGCLANQVWAYRTYIEEQSPFATQQGVKGAEFGRVLVVLDDEEGKEHTQYSYEKYFGLKPLSDTDVKNRAEGKDFVLSRTRRLFYVCCSRALQDLVVVWFANDVDVAVGAVRKASLFNADAVFKVDA